MTLADRFIARVYIAGPMTGYADWNFPLFHAEAARLRSLGYEVVNPAEINVGLESEGWAACMRRDIVWLLECGAIAMLPGWEASVGARLEHHIARALGMRLLMAAEIVDAEPAMREAA